MHVCPHLAVPLLKGFRSRFSKDEDDYLSCAAHLWSHFVETWKKKTKSGFSESQLENWDLRPKTTQCCLSFVAISYTLDTTRCMQPGLTKIRHHMGDTVNSTQRLKLPVMTRKQCNHLISFWNEWARKVHTCCASFKCGMHRWTGNDSAVCPISHWSRASCINRKSVSHRSTSCVLAQHVVICNESGEQIQSLCVQTIAVFLDVNCKFESEKSGAPQDVGQNHSLIPHCNAAAVWMQKRRKICSFYACTLQLGEKTHTSTANKMAVHFLTTSPSFRLAAITRTTLQIPKHLQCCLQHQELMRNFIRVFPILQAIFTA